MGTRSVIATAYPDGVKGRYIHWDGYPSAMAPPLVEIVLRDGLEAAVSTLLEAHYGWSSIDSGQQDGSLGPGMTDGRFVSVPGYGVAYTTEQGQSSPDEWIRVDQEGTWCEYAYVLTPAGLVMCVIGEADRWLVLGTIPWTATPEEVAALVKKAAESQEDGETPVRFAAAVV